MKLEEIDTYISAFTSLRRGNQNAPHKPLLLLAILDQIRCGVITTNRIFITSELLLQFRELSLSIVPDYPNKIFFALPFFHLKGESFWHLKPKLNNEKQLSKLKSVSSLNKLKELVHFAELDWDCFYLATIPEFNALLQASILQAYFAEYDELPNAYKVHEYGQNIERQILNESETEYRMIIRELGHSLDINEFEEEQFIRSGKFKRIVPKIYNHTCAISGHKLESSINIQMIDACHIIPFSESHNDTITNGIALSPSIHRAFDRKIITINNDYIVRVSPTVIESESAYSLKQFDGQKIMLPNNEKYHPSTASLSWHNSQFIL